MATSEAKSLAIEHPTLSSRPWSRARAAARARDQGREDSVGCSMAKLFASDVAMRVTTDAVQAHGGYSYMAEYPVERYMREAKALQIVEGTNQIQRVIIGRHLAGEA